MRLLDAKRLVLVDVRDDVIPPYVILSHTWGDEEITLQELRHMKGRMPQSLDKRKRVIADKKGFLKVKDAAALALSRGYSYIWIDTCCIDKSSSAELSEAINSMYVWYQQSVECYAFLSDVNSVAEEDWSSPDSSLRHSRWFTRGWTLQELVAPKTVHFYSRNWTFLGHKNGPKPFMRIISEVTGIDEEVLDGRIDPLQLSVSARMKWASERHTTRLEDAAYSLMGLFQVNMPLLYGEGRRAFTRLQEEIISRTDDHSLFAWNSYDDAEEDSDALSGLLAQSPDQFKDAGNIQPLPPSPVYASAPSGMTNQGLRVQLYLRPMLEEDGVPMEEDYYAILDCVLRVGDLYQCPVIRLRRLSQDQYARLQTKSRKLLAPHQSGFPELEGYRTIYVRQQPVYYHLPQLRVSPLHMRSEPHNDDHHHFELGEVFPPRHWNSATMTMRVNYSRQLQAMAVFRFQSPSSFGKKIDVVVGLTRIDAMQWEGWCFQRTCQGNSLESTLATINKRVTELARTKHSIISSGMLRDSLGDDSNLMTDANVEGLQLQGRLYISISLSLKPEIQTVTELQSLSNQPGLLFPVAKSQIDKLLLHLIQIQIVTGPCSRIYGKHSILLDEVGSSTEPSAVRGRPSPSSGLAARSLHFKKPLLEFLQHVRDQIKNGEPESLIDVTERLALALFEEDGAETERLLATGVDLEAQTSDLYGFAPLHWAVAGGSIESIRTLLQKGVNPLSVTREGWSAMHVSALFNQPAWKVIRTHDDAEEHLTDLANSRTKDHFETPLHLAAAYSINTEHEFSFFGQLIKDLINYAPLLAQNKHDETPLHRAAAFNNDAIIRSIAVQRNHLRPNFFDIVDRYGRSPLWHAAATGSCEAIMALISLYATINLTDDMGRSPLHAACREGHEEAVKLLLQHGARQSTETLVLGLTPMDLAAMFGHVGCLQNLLIYSAMDILPTRSFTTRNRALHIAASCGRLKCVEMLCASEADPFKPYNDYLKLDNSKSFAIVVEKEGDAQSAASDEGHLEIVKYFDTSDSCKSYRFRKQLGNNILVEVSPVSDRDDLLALNPVAQELVEAPRTDDISSEYPAQNALSTSFRLQPAPPGNSRSGVQRYASAGESYSTSFMAPPAMPFADKFQARSHSTTVPAYSSPAYHQLGTESNDISQYQSYQPATPYPALSYGLSSQPVTSYPTNTYSLSPAPPDLKESSGGNSYSGPNATPSVGPSQSYTGMNRATASLQSSFPAGYWYPSVPVPQVPKPNSSQIVPLRPETVRANLVHLLGSIGNPSMWTDEPPTDSALVRYDEFVDGLVYVFQDSDGAASLDSEGFPIFEMGTDFEADSTVLPTTPILRQEIHHEPGAMIDDSESLEAPIPPWTDGLSDMVSRRASSIDTPGSWDKLD